MQGGGAREAGMPRPRRVGLRRAMAAVTSLLLCVAVALLASDWGAPGVGARMSESIELGETVVAGNASSSITQELAEAKPLSFYEKFMQRLANLNPNSTDDKATKCEEGDEECVPAVASRVSALQVTGNLADGWIARNPHDMHPFQFCAEFSDLTAQELRECLRHLMKPTELARSEPIAHNGTNASLELAVETNHTFNVSDESGWDACYEAFQNPEDKATCLTFVTNKLEGDIAFACTRLDTPEQRLRCKRVTAAVGNVKGLILRQEVAPAEQANATISREQDRVQAIKEMKEEEERTETALQGMQPELKKMLQKTIDISDESNDKISAMEQAINETLLAGPQTALDRLGPKPGPFGELPGKEEHEYMVAKALAANLSATAAAAEAAAAITSVEAARTEMRAIIKRGYDGPGDSSRALQLMKNPIALHTQVAAHVAAVEAVGGAKHAALRSDEARGAVHTQTLLQVDSGMQGGTSVAARLQGLSQLEKLASHGNLADLDAIMDGTVPSPQPDVSRSDADTVKIAAAFGDDGTKSLHTHTQSQLDSALGNFNSVMDHSHVASSDYFKSAAKIAATFKTDSVTGLVDLANDATGDSNDETALPDLAKVMEGKVSMQSIQPSREVKEAAEIAREFNDDGDLAGHLATKWIQNDQEEAAPPSEPYSFDKSFVNIYNKLVTNGKAGTQKIRLSPPLPVHTNSAQQQKLPAARTRAVREEGSVASVQHASALAPNEKVVIQKQAEDMSNLWNKLLNEEAMAKAAKHEAQVAKEQAAKAALKIHDRDEAKREEVKLHTAETRVAEDKLEAAEAQKKAQQVAQRLAQDKFAEMQAAKKADQRQKAFKQAKAEAAKEEHKSERLAEAAKQAASQQAAAKQAAAASAAQGARKEARMQAAVKQKMVAARQQVAVPTVPAVPAASGGEAMIVATVTQLEKNAEEEPVVTPQERQEQKAEIWEAKKLLQQAAMLHKEHSLLKMQAKHDQIVQSSQAAASKKDLKSIAHTVHQKVVKALKNKEAHAAKPAPSAAKQAVKTPGVEKQAAPVESHASRMSPLFASNAPRMLARSTVHTVVAAVVAPAAASVHAAAALPPQAATAAQAVARTQAVAASQGSVAVIQAAASVATAAPVKKTHLEDSLSKAETMEALIKKENAAEEAKVTSFVNSIGSDKDGLGDDDLTRGAAQSASDMASSQQGDDYAAEQQAAVAQINNLAKEASSGNFDSDGSNLGDLINIMNTPKTNIAAALTPQNIERHRHQTKIKEEKRLFDESLHKGPDTPNGVSAEAQKIKEMNAKEDKEISKMPGADAIKRLMTLDAKIKKTRAGMKEHMAKEEEYKKEAAAAQKNMEKLEADNSGMFGLIGALESAGSAGSALGSMIASGLSDAQKPTAKAGAILPQIDRTFSKVWKANLPSEKVGAPNQVAAK